MYKMLTTTLTPMIMTVATATAAIGVLGRRAAPPTKDPRATTDILLNSVLSAKLLWPASLRTVNTRSMMQGVSIAVRTVVKVVYQISPQSSASMPCCQKAVRCLPCMFSVWFDGECKEVYR
jgi:hypothetical protein